MTKKLSWRLKELPDASSIADLVEQEVITKHEARELLFNDDKKSDDKAKIKALEEQVEFLRDIVSDLSRNRVVNLQQYSPPRYNWRLTDWPTTTVLCSTATTSGGVIGASGSNIINAN